MFIINTEKIPIKCWATELESGALIQAKNLANLPFVFSHVCLMPDVHEGYGMPIGGVIACLHTIIPNAVGVDIGCGMGAIKTSLKDIEPTTLKSIMKEIRKVIPLGFNHHKTPQKNSFLENEIEKLKNPPTIFGEKKDLFHQENSH